MPLTKRESSHRETTRRRRTWPRKPSCVSLSYLIISEASAAVGAWSQLSLSCPRTGDARRVGTPVTKLTKLTKTKTTTAIAIASTNTEIATIDSSRENRRRFVVVGAGVGGLATAARVASASSCEVIVLEKNGPSSVGGRCGSFDVHVPGIVSSFSRSEDEDEDGGGSGTFRHERGPSLLLLKDAYEDLFRECSSSSSSRGGSASASGGRAKSMEEYGLILKRCIPAYQVVFDDGDTIELGFPSPSADGDDHRGDGHDDDDDNDVAAKLARSRSKMDSYEPGGSDKWDDYMRATSAFLDCGLPNFIEERLDLPSFPAFLVEALRDEGKAWPLKPHSDVLDKTFASDKMKALASFQDLYVGLEPYRNPDELGGGVLRRTAPAVFGLLSALELHPTNGKAGVYAPVGGFRAVAEAFRSLAEDCGVSVRFGCSVTSVTDRGVHYREGNVDRFLPADVVLINADLPYATRTILSDEKRDDPIHPPSHPHPNTHPFAIDLERQHQSSSSSSSSPPPPTTTTTEKERYDWDDSYDYSSGVIAFHWSVSESLDALLTHNVFLSASSREDMERSWQVLRGKDGNHDNDGGNEMHPPSVDVPFNFYVHRASRTDPTAAPEGCDSIMVLVPCRTLQRVEDMASAPRGVAMERYLGQFGVDFVDRTRKAVLGRMAALDGLKDLAAWIVDEVVDTPGTYADSYNLAAGTPFGLSHGFLQLSLTRPGAQSKDLNNVFYVGASSRPGNGVPLVLLGAKSVAKKVLKKMKQLEKSSAR